MIESFLFALFGFFAAVLLAMLVAPAIWRRAVYLTQKRIESSVPLTINELQADKDRLRAEHAIELRKINMKLDEQRIKATDAKVQVSNLQLALGEDSEALREARSKIESMTLALAEANGTIAQRTTELEEQSVELQTISATLAARSADLESNMRRLEDLQVLHAKLNKDVAALRVQEDNLRKQIEELRGKRRDDQAKARDISRTMREVEEALNNERKRNESLEKKIENAISRQSDLEEKLVRREKELTRLREERAGDGVELETMERRAIDAEADVKSMDAEIGALALRINQLVHALGDADEPEEAIAQLKADVSARSSELEKVNAAYDEVKEQLAQANAQLALAKTGDDKLRDEMHDLAAQVIALSVTLEGEGSDLEAILNTDARNGSADALPLAERVKLLRKAAQSARPKAKPKAAAIAPTQTAAKSTEKTKIPPAKL